MAVQDFTDDPRVEMAMAQQLGKAIGGVFKRSREQKQFEQQKELNSAMQEETLAIIRDPNLTPPQMRVALDGVRGHSQTKVGQKIREREILEATATRKIGATPQDEQSVRLKQIDQLQKNYANTQMYDEVSQQTIAKPGFEALSQGILNRMKQLSAEAFPQETEQRRLAIEQVQPQPEALQESFIGLEQTEGRNFLDDTFKKTEVMEKIGQRLDTLVQGGMDSNQARTQVISEYESLKAEDQGTFQKLPEIDLNAEFGVQEEEGFGNRPDGSKKGNGFLGVLDLKGGGVATEYTVQSNAVKKNGKRIDFPTLVPTLTADEKDLMVNDIIPNNKDVPENIMQKAIQFAKKRIADGQSVFADEEGSTGVPPSSQPQTAQDQEAIAWAGRNIGSSDPETRKQAEDILNINFGTK